MAEQPTQFEFDGQVDMEDHYATWRLLVKLMKWSVAITAVTLFLMFVFLT